MSTIPRILITGAGGFVGRHLAQHLQTLGPADFFGTTRSSTETVDWPSGFQRLQADLLDRKQTQEVLSASRPDQIYHLAGQASVAKSWKSPGQTYLCNIQGQLNLFETVLQLNLKPKILIVCSSDEYGAVDPTELPVRETNPLRPLSPYAISKVAQDLMGFQYFRSSGLPIVRTRAFNHTGPGRPDTYAISGFASQIARMELNQQPPVLHVGDLSIQRDYLDVRDVVRAYAAGMAKGIAGDVYNICAGRPYRLQEAVDLLIARSHIKVQISRDADRIRPADFPVIYGDSTKFQQLTGWRPLIPIEQTIVDLLNHWRDVWSRKPDGVRETV